MPHTPFNNWLLGLFLVLCSACTKLSDLQNAYLNYDICTPTDVEFQSLDYIPPNTRVEVVEPLVRSAEEGYFLSGEVHYYNQNEQLLAIITYGLGPKEQWAVKQIFELDNGQSSFCRFEQVPSNGTAF